MMLATEAAHCPLPCLVPDRVSLVYTVRMELCSCLIASICYKEVEGSSSQAAWVHALLEPAFSELVMHWVCCESARHQTTQRALFTNRLILLISPVTHYYNYFTHLEVDVLRNWLWFVIDLFEVLQLMRDTSETQIQVCLFLKIILSKLSDETVCLLFLSVQDNTEEGSTQSQAWSECILPVLQKLVLLGALQTERTLPCQGTAVTWPRSTRLEKNYISTQAVPTEGF